MQLTLYTKPIDGFPPPPPSPVLSTIYTRPTDNPNFSFLQFKNYLSEFKTEVEKAKVRENLGIPDEYSYNWGHIGGAISNQRDLMSILDRIQSRLSSIETQINGINSTVNTVLGEFDSNITTKSLYSEILKLQIDVAQNSRDIAGIITGGDNSLSIRVNENLLSILTLQSRLDTLTNTVNGINVNSYDDSELRTLISTLLNQILTLQAQISSNELTGISVSQELINVEIGTSDLIVLITAHFTKAADVNVTDQVICNSSNSNVAYWQNNKIVISGVGNATLTFTYTYENISKTTSVSVTVSNVEIIPQIPVQYVGYAQDPTQVVNNSRFECSSIYGTWTPENTPSVGSAPYRFFVITTQNISSIIESGVLLWDLSEQTLNTIVGNNGTVYTIYQSEPLRINDLTITINGN